MKKSLIKRLSLVLLICMLFGVLGTACSSGSEEVVVPGEDTYENLDNTDTSGQIDTGGIQYTYQPPAGEYDIPAEEGYNKLTFYWVNPLFTSWEDYEECDIWIWYDDVDGKGYLMEKCSYGAKVVINVPDTVTEVGFIVRKDCSQPGGTSWGNANKDGGDDRFAIITGKETYIFLKNGDTSQYASDDGVNLVKIKKFNVAGIQDFHTIKYNITPGRKLTNYNQISVWDGDKKLTITRVSTMGRNDKTSGNISVQEKLELDKIYEVRIEGYGSVNAVPMGIFDTEEFGELYNYEGTDLGSNIDSETGKTAFKVWAPTATKVVLDLYENGNEFETVDGVKTPIPGTANDAFKHVEMTRGEKGVWTAVLDAEVAKSGTYYTYTVTTAAGTETATDPYGRAVGLNGNRSMVINLDDTNPDGWTDDNFDPTKGNTVNFDSYSDAFIWEIHIRDFSKNIASSQYPGKYLAFTETGLTNKYGVSVGVDYLKNLGVTHVHLLPSYDFATVKEERANEKDMFNWGYDPKNYNAPEGSYSTNPYDGAVRINEYKQMVQALHNQGIGVIMDVVYNHTFSATDSNFHRIVPYYYYRYNSNGSNMNDSGCGNDTASERYMMGKYIVDSVTYWINEYNLDGFRFDLMGLHDLETMRRVEEAVHAVNPNAIIYGEGWTMGSTLDGSAQANQTNIAEIEPTNGAIGSVAVFNDAMRDGLKGNSGFGEVKAGILQGTRNEENMNKVLFSIRGGTGTGVSWQVNNGMVINYMSAHDNLALWDILAETMGGKDEAYRAQMNRLGAAILFVSKGTPFVQAGEEFLRTKPYLDKDGNKDPDQRFDENSYSSSDYTNNLTWDVLKSGSLEYQTMQYYAGLAAIRKAYPLFSDLNTKVVEKWLADYAYALEYDLNGQKAVVLFNFSTSNATYTFGEGGWTLVATVNNAGTTSLGSGNGTVTINAGEVLIYVK